MADLEPGRIVGQRYTIKRLVARGAASSLYEAITAPSREILLEVFASDTAVAVDVVTRLSQLMAAVNALPAGIVLPIVEATIDGETGCPYIASEASVTPSLAELVKLCPLANEELVSFAGRLCSALDAAHAHGLVHAALDPTRVFVGPAPRCDVRLTGLGAAFLRGHIVDPVWSAPEAYAPTRASDVYSAALLVLYAASGSLPSDPASVVSSAARDILGTGPPEMTLDRRIAGALMRALAPSPSERHASAGDLAKGISEALGSSFFVSSTFRAAMPSSRSSRPSSVSSDALPALAPAPAPPPHVEQYAAPFPPPLPPAATSVDALTTPVSPAGSPSPIPRAGAPTVKIRGSRAKVLIALAAALVVVVLIGVVSAAVGGKKPPTVAAASAKPTAKPTTTESATTVAANAPPAIVADPAPAPAPTPAPAPVAEPPPSKPSGKPSGTEATLVVDCTPECASITVDGESVDPTSTHKPGAHVVVVKRGLHSPQTKYVKLGAGRETKVSFIWWRNDSPPGSAKAGGAKKPCGKFLKRCD